MYFKQDNLVVGGLAETFFNLLRHSQFRMIEPRCQCLTSIIQCSFRNFSQNAIGSIAPRSLVRGARAGVVPGGRGAVLHPAAGAGHALRRPRLRQGVHQEDQQGVQPSRTPAHLEHSDKHVQVSLFWIKIFTHLLASSDTD